MLMNECVHQWMEISRKELCCRELRTGVTMVSRASEQTQSTLACTYTDIHLNHTVGFLLFLIRTRYRITMSSLMKYADGFKDLPLDSAELATGCRKAAVHFPSEMQHCSMSHVLKQSLTVFRVDR